MGSTTIAVDEATRERLKALGGKGESYNDILNDLLDGYVEMQHAKLEEDRDRFVPLDEA